MPDLPRVTLVGRRIVVEGAERCTCGSVWVGWDKGITAVEHVPGRGRPRKPTFRAYGRLRCSQGHLTEADG
jgi:hypothetical protein